GWAWRWWEASPKNRRAGVAPAAGRHAHDNFARRVGIIRRLVLLAQRWRYRQERRRQRKPHGISRHSAALPAGLEGRCSKEFSSRSVAYRDGKRKCGAR